MEAEAKGVGQWAGVWSTSVTRLAEFEDGLEASSDFNSSSLTGSKCKLS